jgi:UDP-2,3-diacylglucosamine hydrolase
LSPVKSIYFLSDFHLGAPNANESRLREKRIVSFLESIKGQTEELFILGDMFDFWFEYRKVVPKGYVRLLGKLAEFTDAGIPIHFFVGNHDMWMRNYFETELNISVYYAPKEFVRNGKVLLLGHGDGLGPGDRGYKIMKKIFRNPVCQFLFGILPPAVGVGLANYFSKKSRVATGKTDEVFLGEENEWLIQFCKRKLAEKNYNYFIFGHRHLPMDIALNEDAKYINLGEWIKYNSYAVMRGTNIELAYFKT